MGKQRKKILAQSKRFVEISEKYSLKGSGHSPTKLISKKSKDALAKFGGVCCDCETKVDEKCAQFSGKEGPSPLPVFRVYNHKTKKELDIKTTDKGFEMDKFVAQALTHLGLAAEDSKKAANKQEL